MAELRETPNLGPIMEFCLIENLFKRLCVWALQPGAYQIERVVDQLRLVVPEKTFSRTNMVLVPGSRNNMAGLKGLKLLILYRL